MAARFDADSDGYTATTGIPTGDLTVCCWGYIAVDRNTFSCLWGMENAASNASQYFSLLTDATGTAVNLFFTGGGPPTPYAASVGTWHKYMVTLAGSTATFYAAAEAAGLTQINTSTSPAVTKSNFFIGRDSFSGEFLNGRVAGVKVWTAALTITEGDAEFAQLGAVRTANLLRSHPLEIAQTKDYGPNGHTLTAGGTTPGTEAGPGVPYERRPDRAATAGPLPAVARSVW